MKLRKYKKSILSRQTNSLLKPWTHCSGMRIFAIPKIHSANPCSLSAVISFAALPALPRERGRTISRQFATRWPSPRRINQSRGQIRIGIRFSSKAARARAPDLSRARSELSTRAARSIQGASRALAARSPGRTMLSAAAVYALAGRARIRLSTPAPSQRPPNSSCSWITSNAYIVVIWANARPRPTGRHVGSEVYLGTCGEWLRERERGEPGSAVLFSQSGSLTVDDCDCFLLANFRGIPVGGSSCC